ncbi:hypothetical protein QR680_008778 [Steinernema hermaphroditum]|uniref:Uncharacterized protein n=1 Tax=Steinernema hermaphroditum TaxID=289476 RepID=A0AA39IJU1_9BILA|nr:hypothetical protein QR680_008778 [Steinernema hermaphroditum]
MKTLLIFLIVVGCVLCGPPGSQSGGNEPPQPPPEPPQPPRDPPHGQRRGDQQQRQPRPEAGSACGITRCSHGGRARFPQPFNCAKYLELGHHGEHVLLEKTCPPDRQFNPLSCKCEENFNCETCTHAQMMGNAGDRHYRLHLDMEKPHQIRCPEGEHYCEQSRHCVSDDF